MTNPGARLRRARLVVVAAIDRHPRHVAAASLACGLACCQIAEPSFSLIGIFVVLALLAGGIRLHLAVMLLAVYLSAGAAGELRLQSIDSDPLASVGASSKVTLVGDVVAVPRPRIGGGFALRVRAGLPGERRQLTEIMSASEARSPSSARSNVQPDPGAPSLSIGDEIVASGRLAKVEDRVGTPESRSYARFLLRNGVRRKLRAESVVFTGTRRGGLYGLIDGVRRRSERTLAAGLAPESAALLRGMVLGGDAGISESTVNAFRVAGLSHILAVSGQNVLLLVILVQTIAGALGLGRVVRIVIPVALICIYVPLCGAQASVVRAGVMGLAGLAAVSASRPSSRIYALLLGAIAVLAWNPRATADVGAQLSFAAVLGIVVFARPLATRLRRWPNWIAEGLAVTAGATLATAPLMALHFGAFSLISLVANLFAGPLIGPIVWLGSLAAAVGQLSQSAGSILNAPNEFLLGSLITLARVAASVPGAQVELPSFGLGAFAIATVVIVVLGLAVNGLLPRPRPRPRPRSRHRARSRRLARHLAPRLLAISVAVVAVAWAITPAPVRLPRPAIVFLDVGQGDATLLLGSDGCAALIDGGPPGQDLPARLKRMGVKRLDLVMATHPQLDHDGGLTEIQTAGRPAVKAFLDSGGSTTEPRYISLRNGFMASTERVEPAVEGAEWSCSDLSIKLLGPREQPPNTPPPADPNTRAAVAVVRAGSLTMLAAGDAESPQLLPLPLPGVDVLKVSHHGSKDDGLPALLARVGPRIAAIGVGADNRYGHPAPQTLGALSAAGASIYRSDRDGTVVVIAGSSDEPLVRTHAE